MKSLSRKTKARINGYLSPAFLLVAVLGLGALVITAHVIALVMVFLGSPTPWMENSILAGPAIALTSFTIVILRRLMASRGWGAVRSGALKPLVELLDATPNSHALQAALAARAQSQAWMSWSCVFDVLSQQGLSNTQYQDLRSSILCPWGPAHSLHGPIATTARWHRHLKEDAWRHACLQVNTPSTPIPAAPAVAARF